jgi:hypothetical protein
MVTAAPVGHYLGAMGARLQRNGLRGRTRFVGLPVTAAIAAAPRSVR